MEESLKNNDSKKEISRAKSDANLKPIKKGEVRNPTGRPKKEICIPDILRRMSKEISEYDPKQKKTKIEKVCDMAFKQAQGGDKDARNWISDRMEGKAIDRIITQQADDELVII